MSSTRRAAEGSDFRQERFASSQEFERGLMANLVARRCSVLERAEDRELIWFIQLLSHQMGGIKKLAAELIAKFPDRRASVSMRKFGMKPAQVYSAEQVKAVRDEVGGRAFPLKGEINDDVFSVESLLRENGDRKALLKQESQWHPSSYPASEFVKCCNEAAAAGLEQHLLALCLDPALPVVDGSPWYFPTLISTLREFQSKWIAERQNNPVTQVGAKIAEALDYSMESRRMVIIDGVPRIGKSHGAKAWCNSHPGCARYVECPPGNDDFSFFREIALSLGVSINLKSKSQELRMRIEDTLRAGNLNLVIDQAHCLWPQSNYRNTTPARINWIMALADRGVAISLICTPQFFRSQNAIEKTTCWTSEQFTGRIGHYEKLPDSLSAEDLKSVAVALLLGGSDDSIKALVYYAQSSRKYLAGIDAIVNRARFICQKDGRNRVEFRDIKRAIQESVIPSDEALTGAIESVTNPARKRAAKVYATPLQPAIQTPAITLPTARIPARSMRPATRQPVDETELIHA